MTSRKDHAGLVWWASNPGDREPIYTPQECLAKYGTHTCGGAITGAKPCATCKAVPAKFACMNCDTIQCNACRDPKIDWVQQSQ